MKHIVKYTILILSLLALLIMPAAAEEEEAETVQAAPTSGTCGENVTWKFENHTMTISGSGPMEDFKEESPPWEDYKEEIQRVVFTGDVTTVGWNSFKDCDSITSVDFGKSMHTIGAYSFSNCDGLTQIRLPETFRIFDVECLRNCSNLRAIHCDGGIFPSFKGSCLWNTQTKIIYPANNPWPVELIDQLENAFTHHIEFVDSNGVDHNASGYESNFEDVEELEEVIAQAETVPETTVPETTVPPTTLPPVTVPETTAPAVPETTAATEPEIVTPETEAPTESTGVVWEMVKPTEAPEKKSGISSKTGVIILGAVVGSILLATIIFIISEKRRNDFY